MRRMRFVIAGCIVLAGGVVRAAERVDFDRQIRPIFAEQCVSCHGTEKQKGGLRLDQRDLAMDGGTSGKAILPGFGDKSLLVQRMRGMGGEDPMPLKKEPLPAEQIALVSRWINEGADWPAGPAVATPTHWSFVPPVRPAEPVVKNVNWGRTPIDHLVLSRLESEGLKPSPEASRETLLRRASLDLTGLPPSPAEMDAFLHDSSANAYEKVVDRLLASPHYGERWARHWLDGARYSDSNGYSLDNPRSIWPYRDWVINSLNRDLPFDQFTIEQLAGDLLPNATVDQKIATGFHRNTQINEEGGIDKEQFRIDSVFDRVGTTGTVFLGLTVGCAQCHNHKFDPISQREYYRLFAFFNNCDEPKLVVPNSSDPDRRSAVQEKMKALDAEFKRYNDSATQKLPEWEAQLAREPRPTLSAAEKAALKVPAAKRSAKQKQVLFDAILASDAEYVRKKEEYAGLKQETEGVTTLVMQERKEPRDSWILIKGDFTRHGDAVTPGTPAVLPSIALNRPTRLDLARWLVDPANPLTARVQVNRMWLHFFGRGLVETENDFGTQGSKPTNQPLLDWLATEYVRLGWQTKAVHRLIVTSAVYRQSSNLSAGLLDRDPYNHLLARQSRVRLDAEVVRDTELVASGLLSDKVGGPSVFPPQPDGVLNVGQVKRVWKVSSGADRYRRGLYTWVWRLTPHPLLTSFDAPDPTLTCTRRNRSNTPLQALTLLNDEGFVEFSRAMASRVLREAPAEDASRLTYAFRLATSRAPSSDELGVLHQALAKQRRSFSDRPQDALGLVADQKIAPDQAAERAAWIMTCRIVLNLDESISRE